MILSDVIEYGARKHPERVALRYEKEVVTYAELRERSRRLANKLLTVAQPGDRVAILSQNCIEYFDCYYGVPMAGMALTILNFRLQTKQLISLLENAEPTVLVVADEFADFADAARDKIQSLQHTIVIGGSGDDCWQRFVEDASSESPAVRPKEDDLAWLVYTSGTTGAPKGVMVTHRNLVSGVVSSAVEWEAPADNVFLTCLPLCHIAGYMLIMMHLLGHTVGIIRSYDNATFLRYVDEWGVTQTGLAPTLIAFLLRDPALNDYDLSSLDSIGYGASAMPPALLREGMERFECDFFQGMGMTELVGNAIFFNSTNHKRAAQGEDHLLQSVGKPMRMVDVRVVDDESVDVPMGEVGEMIVRGDQVTTGYWKNPEATATSFTKDGWFKTGDLVRQDEEGFVYIVDRKKDLIISGGENISSLAVEQVLYKDQRVAEAAAVGGSDETWGEVVCAVVVLRDGETASADDIIDKARESLGGFQVPRQVQFADALPKNVMGKVLKRELRKRFTKQSA